MAVSFKGAHFPPEIILTCVRWYVDVAQGSLWGDTRPGIGRRVPPSRGY